MAIRGIASLAVQLADLRSAHDIAERAFEQAHDPRADEDDAEYAAWLIEIVFLKLLVLVESLGLPSLRAQIAADMDSARSGKEGFSRSVIRDEGPSAYWLARIRQYARAIDVLCGPAVGSLVTRSLEEILRACVYPITDPSLFPAAPTCEAEVHSRIEGILKCVFLDLKHAPVLTKPIKNFIPDTGLPGLRTLVEYKFVNSPAAIKDIADQVLADTRGYHSPDYERYLYVIYETIRLRPESEWTALLSECGVPPNTSVIVLSGTPAAAKVPPTT